MLHVPMLVPLEKYFEHQPLGERLFARSPWSAEVPAAVALDPVVWESDLCWCSYVPGARNRPPTASLWSVCPSLPDAKSCYL